MDSDDEREHDGKDRIESVSFGDKKKGRGDASMIEYGVTNRAVQTMSGRFWSIRRAD